MEALSLAALIIGASVAFSMAGVLAGRWIVRGHISDFHNEVMIAIYASAKVVYAVLLGFLVVVVWEAYDSAHRNVAHEAAMLVPLYRLTYGMDPVHGSQSRALIRLYAQAVITDEWPTLGRENAGGLMARRAIGEMDRQFARLDPAVKAADAQIDAEFLRTKSAIVNDRNERLLEASHGIPWVMWLGAVGGGVITMVMSFLIYMERLWPHALMTALDGALTGLLLFVMVVFSHPFSGPLAIGPDYFASALLVMDGIDKGD